VVNKSKEFVSQAQIIINSETTPKVSSEEREPLIAQQTTKMQERQLVNEISYNQALIIEREHGIQEIQAAMNEINTIFKDIGMLVTEQQLGFDNIAENVEMIASRTRNAANEIRIAEDYRRRRPLVNCWWFMLALLLSLIIIAFILSL
jgi:syntaxin 7